MRPDPRSRIVLDAGGQTGPSTNPDPDRPFHILLAGDFSGAAARAGAGPAPVLVDRDSVDAALERFRPRLQVQLGGEGGPGLEVEFASLDDFHPDRLVERVPILRALYDLREHARAARAAPSREAAGRGGRAPAPPVTSLAAEGGSLLDMIVGEGDASPVADRSGRPRDELHAYVHELVAPHLERGPGPAQEAIVSKAEETLTSFLRAILHDPQFQALEALWRGASFLVRRLDTGPHLKVFLLDLSAEGLARDLAPSLPIEATHLYRVLVEDTVATPGAVPWAVVVGAYAFGPGDEDAALLGRISELARRANAPFLACAAPALAGVESFAASPDASALSAGPTAAWSALRRSAGAPFLGLALPRFLLRHPYDPEDEPCDVFPLSELEAAPAHEDYLWGNPAIACALLLGEAFVAAGWRMGGAVPLEISGLPLHIHDTGGGAVAKPCAEAVLTDRVAARLVELGVMPLLSPRDSASVRVARMQSIAEPAAALAGAWSGAAA